MAYLDVLLPFTQQSHLDEFTIKVENGSEIEGPAGFIFRVTKGVLRDVMILIRDACRDAILSNRTCLEMAVLERTWKNVQEQPNPRNEITQSDENEDGD